MPTPEEITLDPTTPEATLRHLMDNAYPGERPWHLWLNILRNPQLSEPLLGDVMKKFQSSNGTWIDGHSLEALNALADNAGLDLLLLTNPNALANLPSRGPRSENLWTSVARQVAPFEGILKRDAVDVIGRAWAGTPLANIPSSFFTNQQIFMEGTIQDHGVWTDGLFRAARVAADTAVKRRKGGAAAQGASFVLLVQRAVEAMEAARVTAVHNGTGAPQPLRPIPPGVARLARLYGLW